MFWQFALMSQGKSRVREVERRGGDRKEKKKARWELKRDCKGEKEGRDTLETDNTNHLRKYGRGRVAKKLADQTKKREERAYNKKIGAGCEKDKNG